MEIKYCFSCGEKQVVTNARFCSSCGSPLTGDTVQKSTNSRSASRRSSRLDLFLDEVVAATKGRAGGKSTQVEYTSDEIRKSADIEYQENLSALVVALGLELKGGEI